MALKDKVSERSVRNITINFSDLARKEVRVDGIHEIKSGRPFGQRPWVDWTSASTGSERRVFCLGAGLADDGGSIAKRRSTKERRLVGATDGCHTADQGEKEDGNALHGAGVRGIFLLKGIFALKSVRTERLQARSTSMLYVRYGIIK